MDPIKESEDERYEYQYRTTTSSGLLRRWCHHQWWPCKPIAMCMSNSTHRHCLRPQSQSTRHRRWLALGLHSSVHQLSTTTFSWFAQRTLRCPRSHHKPIAILIPCRLHSLESATSQRQWLALRKTLLSKDERMPMIAQRRTQRFMNSWASCKHLQYWSLLITLYITIHIGSVSAFAAAMNEIHSAFAADNTDYGP